LIGFIVIEFAFCIIGQDKAQVLNCLFNYGIRFHNPEFILEILIPAKHITVKEIINVAGALLGPVFLYQY
jgi:hypothetical protein